MILISTIILFSSGSKIVAPSWEDEKELLPILRRRVSSKPILTGLRFLHMRPAVMYSFGNRFITHTQAFKDRQISAQITRSTRREIYHHTHVRKNLAYAVQFSQTGFHLSKLIYLQTTQKSSHPSCLTLKDLRLSWRGYPSFLQTSSGRPQTKSNDHVITYCKGRWVSESMENSVNKEPFYSFCTQNCCTRWLKYVKFSYILFSICSKMLLLEVMLRSSRT